MRTIETFQVPPRWILVRVSTDDGRAGWGECIIPKRARAVRAAVADIGDNLIGADARRIEDIWQRMHRDGFFRGGPVLMTAAAGIEQALWDLKARAADLPVYDFLGGAVRERVRTYAWIAGDQPDDALQHARQRVDQGFTAVKMNATAASDHLDRFATIDHLVGQVAAIREEFPDLGIALDFHGRVHRSVAKILLRELEPYRLMWVEEPTIAENEDVLPHLRDAAGAVPIATGERLMSRWQFTRILQEGTVDIIQPDVSLTGLFELEKIARMAEAYDVAVAPHCPNGPVSLAASLQVAYCCPNVVIQEQSGGIHYHQGYDGLPSGELFDYVTSGELIESRGGFFARRAEPGLGITVDDTAVRSADSSWRLPDPNWRHEDGRYAEW
ncbi:galactonate dehydratase [Actinobacteria bacterium YIM 96077]|uniref:Galactonate dehydratase n=1 Tax=Phytoactinopolyspora halophila TaxID=1981511 RepID=A0A329R3V7_9ACTN|nr:galactonate dehydratase [Actinobacteria bacterium YIM 96077]RAW17698.1 galactonate dehydratase [Phytoactinopolyspora halophila]